MSLSEDDLIDRFLKGELSHEEASDFQKRIESDQDLAQRVALEQQLFEVFNEDDWSNATNKNHPEVAEYTALFASDETKKLKEAIAISQEAYRADAQVPGPTPKIRQFWMYASAAVLLVLATFVFLFLNKETSESLYQDYLSKTELPSTTSRGSTKTHQQLALAQERFEEGAYTEARVLLRRIDADQIQSAAFYIYLSLSLAEEGQYDEAIDTIDELIRSDLLDSSKGYWYKSLIYLKAEQVAKSKGQLDLIIANQYYQYQLAKELLESF